MLCRDEIFIYLVFWKSIYWLVSRSHIACGPRYTHKNKPLGKASWLALNNKVPLSSLCRAVVVEFTVRPSPWLAGGFGSQLDNVILASVVRPGRNLVIKKIHCVQIVSTETDRFCQLRAYPLKRFDTWLPPNSLANPVPIVRDCCQSQPIKCVVQSPKPLISQ